MTYAGKRRVYEPAPVQAALDTLDQGVSVFDGELRLVAWNRRFVELLRLPAELAGAGVPFQDLVRHLGAREGLGGAALDELVAARVRGAAECRRFYSERTTPEGRVLAAQTTPLPDGGFVTVYTDISERATAESLSPARTIELEARVNRRVLELRLANEELRQNLRRLEEASAARAQSEARLGLITDALPAAIAYVDEQRRLSFANRRFAALFGRTSQEVIGHHVRELFGHKVLAELSPHIEKAYAGEPQTFEHNYTGLDGKSGITRNILIPERGPEREGARVLGLFVLSLDVTEEKRAERALHEAQKMSAIGQLAGGLAHDFNNLLTIIVGNLCSLEDHIGGGLVREYVAPAVRASYRGVDITRRLLAFARQQSLEPLAVDVAALIAATAQLLRRSLPSHITIHCNDDGDGWAALVDPAQLENAIVNLALNARDAMREGGVLAFAVAGVHISDGEDDRLAPGDYVSVTVSDTGTGIAPEVQARIFEPFFTTKPFGSGSGLGLSMVFGFARQSGGDIRLVSDVGKGTRVTLLLPRAVGVAPLVTQQVEAVVTGGSGELVLLVEDDHDVRHAIRRQLLELGYRVLEARDGDDAELLLQSAPEIAILVSDIIMPGARNGLALAEHARRTLPAIKVVLISGSARFSDYEHAHDWLDEGMILHKPFGRDDLARALAKKVTS